jgi:molecular chaperone GrpE
MALQSVPEQERGDNATNKPLKDLYTGVNLTRNEMMKTFGKYGIHEYNPMGEQFDPNLHNALFQAPVEGKEPGTVFSVQKTGFKIQDRILRAAQVGVVKGDS